MAFFVEVPPSPPRPFGITSVASVIDNSSANWRGDRIAFETLGCAQPPMPILSACPEDYLVMNSAGELEYTRAKQVTAGAGFGRGEVVTLYSINDCFLDGTVGNAGQQANWQAQALAGFNRGESGGLESAFAQLAGKESGKIDETVYDAPSAYLRLVELMGDYTGVPTYHMDLLAPRLIAFEGNRIIQRRGNRLEDEYGGLVSVGQGYHRAGVVGPDGEGVNPDDTVRWMYGTGAVYIWRAPALVHTVPSPETNRGRVLVERTYAIGTDCGPVAVRYGYTPTESDAVSTPLPVPDRAPARATVTALEPDSAAISNENFEAHVRGTGFTENTVIVWNHADEPTRFVSDTDVWTMAVPSVVTAPTRLEVTVREDGYMPPPLMFTWTEAASEPSVPTLTSLAPDFGYLTETSVPVTLTGTGFTEFSVVAVDGEEGKVNGSSWTPTELGFTFYSSNSQVGTVEVTARAKPGAAEDSNALTFEWLAEPEPEPDLIPVVPDERVVDDMNWNEGAAYLNERYVGEPKTAWSGNATFGPDEATVQAGWNGEEWNLVG